jgi:nitronate monooxygenase
MTMTREQSLGLDVPIIQAPMAGSGALPIGVCSAGGLGSLPCAALTTDAMRQELTAIAAQTRGVYNASVQGGDRFMACL